MLVLGISAVHRCSASNENSNNSNHEYSRRLRQHEGYKNEEAQNENNTCGLQSNAAVNAWINNCCCPMLELL